MLSDRNVVLEKKIEEEQAVRLLLEQIIQDTKNQEETVHRNHEVELSAL